jgi:hypothetical protein
MTEQGPARDLLPFPFPLPEGFVQRLGYRFGRRLVAVYCASDKAAWTDGVDTLIGADHYVYGELLHQPQVREWLWEHEIQLGDSLHPEEHWLLIDQLENRAYICPVRAADDKVRTQRLEE